MDRQVSFDYLRAISCISVVILHISSIYLKKDFVSLASETDWVIASFWRVLTNLAVPSFVMLSGAFIIRSEAKRYKDFYFKMFRRIVLPTLIVSVIYVIMHYAEIIMAHILGMTIELEKMDLWNPIKNMVYGKPHSTMWYMYMIIPLYFVTPVIVMVKESLSVKWYRRLAVIMMCYGLIVEKSCSLSWVLQFACWLGYFMLGDVIREWAISVKNSGSMWHYHMIRGAIIAYLSLSVYWYIHTYKTSLLTVPSSFSWIVIFSTILQFVGVAFSFTEKVNGWINIRC